MLAEGNMPSWPIPYGPFGWIQGGDSCAPRILGRLDFWIGSHSVGGGTQISWRLLCGQAVRRKRHGQALPFGLERVDIGNPNFLQQVTDLGSA